MKLNAKRGRNQQGLCFVSTRIIDSLIETHEISCKFHSVYADVKGSEKVPEGIIILDGRIYDMLGCEDEDEVNLEVISNIIPTCEELHLDVISKRNLVSHEVAQAISKRIDDFKEHFEGLVLYQGQRFTISELGVSFVVRYLSPTELSTHAARIKWNNLLKIHLEAVDSQPNNLCILIEVAAATQIADVKINPEDGHEGYITRHEAILQTLSIIRENFRGYGNSTNFVGIAFADKISPFITFNSQTGEEVEISSLYSSVIFDRFRKWLDTIFNEFSDRPSNPGAAISYGLEKAQSLHEVNGYPTLIVLFASGVYSAGQNPVKITRMNIGDIPVRILCVSTGINSETDIMDAIAKEGNGILYHLDCDDKMNLVVDEINNMTSG